MNVKDPTVHHYYVEELFLITRLKVRIFCFHRMHGNCRVSLYGVCRYVGILLTYLPPSKPQSGLLFYFAENLLKQKLAVSTAITSNFCIQLSSTERGLAQSLYTLDAMNEAHRSNTTNSLTPWLMEPGCSISHSQRISDNPYSELNQPNS